MADEMICIVTHNPEGYSDFMVTQWANGKEFSASVRATDLELLKAHRGNFLLYERRQWAVDQVAKDVRKELANRERQGRKETS